MRSRKATPMKTDLKKIEVIEQRFKISYVAAMLQETQAFVIEQLESAGYTVKRIKRGHAYAKASDVNEWLASFPSSEDIERAMRGALGKED